MSWESLPIELRVQILSIRYNIRNNSSILIQNTWNKYLAKIENVIEVALELQVNVDGIFLVSSPSTSRIMEYCANVVNRKHHRAFWEFIIEQIQIGLFSEEFTGGPGAIYYNRTEIACDKLIKKLNTNI